MSNLPEIEGIKFKTGIGDEVEATFGPLARAAFGALLVWLPEGWELSFFDQYYPSPTDPGAYVTIQRRADRFVYSLGNHGWSSKWQAQSPEFLAAWMHLNLRRMHRHSEALRSVGIRRAVRSAWDTP